MTMKGNKFSLHILITTEINNKYKNHAVHPNGPWKLRNCSFICQNHLLVEEKIWKCADLWSLLLKKMEKKGRYKTSINVPRIVILKD